MNGKESESYRTNNCQRHGCPCTANLFSAYVSNIVEIFQGVQVGGVVIGKEKLGSFAYGDDLVILSRDERGMKEMINQLERQLQVNVAKSKIMILKKAKRKRKEAERL